MTSFPITDKHGHSYVNQVELTEAAEWLEQDAAYLREQANLTQDSMVKQMIADNAEKSAQYARELRNA